VSAASARAVRQFDQRAVGAYVTYQVSNGWTLGYDPCIFDAFGGVVENADMRICGEIRILAPLVLRGEASNFLLLETAMKMTVRGPKENLVVIPGCGHAPALMAGRSDRNHPGLACY
jgi:hypothetical protein